jgi:hypothetical protein
MPPRLEDGLRTAGLLAGGLETAGGRGDGARLGSFSGRVPASGRAPKCGCGCSARLYSARRHAE